MPPKAKITKEMIIDAAFEIAREDGADNINARTIAKRLSCSTQPVMYHFKKIEDIKAAVYRKADDIHTAYIMDCRSDDPMMDIGLNFIRFAATEKNLFRFLFQSGSFTGKNIAEITTSDDLLPILQVLAESAGGDVAQAKKIFSTLALYVHGLASVLANNALEYDESAVAEDLERVFTGAVYASKEEMQ